MRKTSEEMSWVLDVQAVSVMKCKFLILFVVMALTSFFYPHVVSATPILSPELASFAVLGATASVTNTGDTTLTGDVGVSPAASITGQSTLVVNGINALLNTGDVHQADATANLAQTQLAIARTRLGLLGPGTLQPVDLAGLTLVPGIYTVPAGPTNLSGTLTLDGLNNPNAFWVFQMPGALITSSGSVVSLINAGTGAGVFWNVASSASLGTTTSFQGNILALTSITMDTGATIGCGRALANTGAVTMDTNTIGTDCSGNGFVGSGLVFDTGGNVVDTTTNRIVASAVPEPGTFLLLGFGLAGFMAFGKRFKKI